MRKRSLVVRSFLLGISAMLFPLNGLARADDVFVEVQLDPGIAKYSSTYGSTTFSLVTVSLVATNLSDRVQTLTLKKSYHFYLMKVSAPVPGVDPGTALPFVAEGYLQASYGQAYPTVDLQPHTRQVVAFGQLPTAITVRYSYKGYILPGTYVMKVELPSGLMGVTAGAETEATLVIR